MAQAGLLITGAAGQTGRYTTETPVNKGVPVRALVHTPDARAQALGELGAEVISGDLLDFDQVRQALDGIQSAYFVYPIQPGLLDATAYFAQSAKEAGVQAVVKHVPGVRAARS